jgi:predicted metalloprotease
MRGSQNVEDREGMPAGGGGRLPGGGLKLGGAGLIAVVVLSLIMGQNPLDVLVSLQGEGMPGAPVESQQGQRVDPSAPHRDENKEFVVRVLGDTEDTWTRLLGQAGGEYRAPKLVLFRGRVESACGLASSAVGPFYCPPDSQVYLDTTFFQELRDRFGAPGDFARAYVIAHEIGHHVQNLLGISEQVHRQRARASQTAANQLSVRQELQADCLAGVWGHYARQRNLLEPGDLEAGLTAAAAIGDDRLQRQAQGEVRPESFTHGSSQQRVRWFRTGFDSGDVNQCNTFKAGQL